MGTTHRFTRALKGVARRSDHETADLRAELELARAEIARLRSEQHRPDDPDRAVAGVERVLASLATFGDDGDEVWARYAETERLRTSLLELCNEFEKALHAARVELDGRYPLVEVDRRRTARSDLELAGLRRDDDSPAA